MRVCVSKGWEQRPWRERERDWCACVHMREKSGRRGEGKTGGIVCVRIRAQGQGHRCMCACACTCAHPESAPPPLGSAPIRPPPEQQV